MQNRAITIALVLFAVFAFSHAEFETPESEYAVESEFLQSQEGLIQELKHMREAAPEHLTYHVSRIHKHAMLIQKAKAYGHDFSKSSAAIKAALNSLLSQLNAGHKHDKAALAEGHKNAKAAIATAESQGKSKCVEYKNKSCPTKRISEEAKAKMDAAHTKMRNIGKGKMCDETKDGTWGGMDVDKSNPKFGTIVRNAWDKTRAKYVSAHEKYQAEKKVYDASIKTHTKAMAAFTTAVKLESGNTYTTCRNGHKEYNLLKNEVASNVASRKQVYIASLVISCYVDNISVNSAAKACADKKRRADTSQWNISASNLANCVEARVLETRFGPLDWKPSSKTCELQHWNERAHKEKITKEKNAKERDAKERDAKEKSKKEKDAKEVAAKREKATKERDAKEKAEKEKAAKAKLERDTKHKKEQKAKKDEKDVKEKTAKEKAAKERNAKEKVEKERAAKERDSKEKASKERAGKAAAKERSDKEKAHKAKVERDNKEKSSKERTNKERTNKEVATKEKNSKEVSEKEKAAKAKLERDQKAHKERKAKEDERNVKEKSTKERNNKEATSKERTNKERTNKERTNKERTNKERSSKESSNKAKVRVSRHAWHGWINNWDGNMGWHTGGNTFVSGLHSTHSNHREDRLFKPLVTTIGTNQRSHHWYGWINNWDGRFDFTCGGNMAIIGFSSYHDNGREDRRWKVLCSTFHGLNIRHDGWPGWQTNWDATWSLSCGHRPMVGMSSYHDNGREDRRWRIRCGTISARL